MSNLDRRTLLSSILTFAASSVVMPSSASEETATPRETTVQNEAPPADVTGNDLAGAIKVAGRDFTVEQRHQMLAKAIAMRTQCLAVRKVARHQSVPTAMLFRVSDGPVKPPQGLRITPKKYRRTKGIPTNKELAAASIGQLAAWLRDGKTTSVALTQLAIDRCNSYGSRLLCIVSMRTEAALLDAIQSDKDLSAGIDHGPLHGIPYGVKDLFATTDLPTTFGAPPFREQFINEDATVVARLRDAGAILVAKLSMGELAMGDVWFGGTTRNPWNTTRGSSGSSAGSAAAVSACLLPFAIGTETYGSITSPCAECGTTGLRPTFGRVSRAGAMALSWTMDKIGPITRSVDDAALVFAVICGPDGKDRTLQTVGFTWNATTSLKGLRVGYDHLAFENAEPSQKSVVDYFRSQGVVLVPITLPATTPAFDALPDVIITAEGAAAFSDLLDDGRLQTLVQQDDWNWPNAFRIGSLISATDYISSLQLRSDLQVQMDIALRNVDGYLTPALSAPSLPWTNLTGHPSVITRCGMNAKGLPVSVEFTGNLWREDVILRLAYVWEQHYGPKTTWPNVETAPSTPPTLAKSD